MKRKRKLGTNTNLSTEEAADQLGVSGRMIYTYIKMRLLKAQKFYLGPRKFKWMIPKSQVKKLRIHE